MFKVGDTIVYGSVGVCKLVGIKDVKSLQTNTNEKHYVLESLYQSMTVKCPIANLDAPLRHIISKRQALKLIDSMPEYQTITDIPHDAKALHDYYIATLRSHDLAELASFTMLVFAKSQELKSNAKTLSMADRDYLKKAEELLFGELAIALNIPFDEVQPFIVKRLQRNR